MDTLLQTLNPAQRDAVTHQEGPLLVLAGAGSGKTRVLTQRIAYLIHQHQVEAQAILALTFTNKAGREMRTRIEKLLGPQATQGLFLGTFHSVFCRILRKEAHLLGYPSSFTIYDTADSKSLLKSIVQDMDLDDKAYNPGQLLGIISAAKNQGYTPLQYKEEGEFQHRDRMRRMPLAGDIFSTYQARCIKAGAMDFDDLLVNMHRILQEFAERRLYYQERFSHVLVDEFQDTNPLQYSILRLLSAAPHNLCVVGDDAQSIYGFRGASIGNMLGFSQDYPGCKLIKLEENYRSTEHILRAASAIIQKNPNQLAKTLWTQNGPGAPVAVLGAKSDLDEAYTIAQAIYEAHVVRSVPYSEIAILYRTNSQSRVIEESLRRMGIAYRIVGGLGFYQRKIVKDALAYLRLLVNPSDEASLKRIINTPRRGIGQSSLEALLQAVHQQGIPLFEALRQAPLHVSLRTAPALQAFAQLFDGHAALRHAAAYTAAHTFLQAVGLLHPTTEEHSKETQEEQAHLQELLHAIQQSSQMRMEENQADTLEAFLAEATLEASAMEEASAAQQVSLMTIHTAKGLEFNEVFVVGMEEGLFPSSMAESPEDIEEERRLCYVAITRARARLHLSYAHMRMRYGHTEAAHPSRFLQEIGYTSPAEQKFSPKDKVHRAQDLRLSRPSPQQPLRQAVTPLDPSKVLRPEDVRLDMQVTHAHFGTGKVVELMYEKGLPTRACVDFARFGQKTLLLSFAQLIASPQP